MRHENLRQAIVSFCILALVLGPIATPLLAASSDVTGRVAGQVLDRATGMPVAGARIEARRITTNELFESAGSDALGAYLIDDVPAGIYAVDVIKDSTRFAVEDRIDVRVRSRFLLEACFELDSQTHTASLREPCLSGLYAETQVVSLGAGRYFRPDLPPTTAGSVLAQPQPLTIDHSGLECVTHDSFPQLDAEILRQIDVAFARVYFRAGQYPDFYFIDMSTAAGGFQGIFPRPSPETSEIVYYVEAMDTAGGVVQSNEFTVPVVSVEECRDRAPAAVFFTGTNPAITVGSTVPGAAAQPAGFMTTGIVNYVSTSGAVIAGAVAAAGGGLSNTQIILIIAAAAGTITAIILLANDEDEASEIR